MNELIENIKKSNIKSVFSLNDLYEFGLEKEYVDEKLDELVRKYDVFHVQNDIFILGKTLRKELVSEEVLAQKLVPESYVSMEFALSQISWIPENVYVVTCVTKGNHKNINTEKFGYYEFINISQKSYSVGVKKYSNGNNYFYKANPLKALADIIYERRYEWKTLKPLNESLRIENDYLESLTKEDFDELHDNYSERNVEDFLCGIRKELRL
jgi:hypothetical protein